MTTPLLEIRDLSVHYAQRGSSVLKAVDEVSFDVGAGETVGLVGESGSGKSTIAGALMGLAPVHAGTISVDGRDVTHLGFKARRELFRDVSIVFQDPYGSLNPSRTVAQTLAEPLLAFGERDAAKVDRRVVEMLDRVHLPPSTKDRFPSEFSGGQRQRIAIARALMLAPRLVVCDEAVSALDLSVQAQIINLLRELQEASGISFLFISHDLDVVRYMCDRVVVLYRGRIMETGNASAMSESPAHPYTEALQSAVPLPNPRLQRERRALRAPRPTTVTPPAGVIGDACPFVPRCPYAQDVCRRERPALRRTQSGGLAACHRYPEWQAERLPEREVGDRSTPLVAPTKLEVDRGRAS